MTEATNDQTPASVLEQLVGEGKKFQDTEALARGKAEADAFIKKLEGENRDLKALVTGQDQRLAKLESRLSILDRLGNDTDDSGSETPQPNREAKPDAGNPTPSGLNESDTIRLIEKFETNKLMQANKQLVDNVLAKSLGTDAAAFVKQRAGELGVSVQEIHAMALQSPKAFFAMLGLNPEGSTSGSMYTGSGARALPNKDSSIRNQAYYDKLKTEKGAKAFVLDKSLQIQMHRDMQQLGDAFFS